MILCILNYQLNYFIKYIYNINILIFQQNIYHKNTKHRVKSRIKTKEYQQNMEKCALKSMGAGKHVSKQPYYVY